MTGSISSRISRRLVRFVEAPNPRLLCFMGSMVSGNHAGAKHMARRFLKTFPGRPVFMQIPGILQRRLGSHHDGSIGMGQLPKRYTRGMVVCKVACVLVDTAKYKAPSSVNENNNAIQCRLIKVVSSSIDVLNAKVQ